MKNSFLIFIICLFFSNAFSQKKCEYEKNEIDQFTKSKDVITAWSYYSNGSEVHGGIKLGFSRNVYKLYFSCNFQTTIQQGMSVDQGQEVIILLENGETIVSHSNVALKCATMYQPGLNGNYNAEVHTNCNLTAEQIAKMKTSPLKSIRVYMKLPSNSVSTCDLGADKKKTNALIELINCIEKS